MRRALRPPNVADEEPTDGQSVETPTLDHRVGVGDVLRRPQLTTPEEVHLVETRLSVQLNSSDGEVPEVLGLSRRPGGRLGGVDTPEGGVVAFAEDVDHQMPSS